MRLKHHNVSDPKHDEIQYTIKAPMYVAPNTKI